MNERLGYSPTDRLVIINADDFGMSGSSNDAIITMYRDQSITSSSIMMPCKGANEAAIYSKNNQANVGILRN